MTDFQSSTGTEEPTATQIAAADRAMDGLEAQADIWADEISLVLAVKNLGKVARGLTDRMPKDVREGFIDRLEANIDAMARQAYLEGFYRGGESRKDYDAAQALIAAQLMPGLEAISAERLRQISEEGWSSDHDDDHTEGDLAHAALCYVYAASFSPTYNDFVPRHWPWNRKWWKPAGKRRNLVIAGALIAAEIDRLDRASALPSTDRSTPESSR